MTLYGSAAAEAAHHHTRHLQDQDVTDAITEAAAAGTLVAHYGDEPCGEGWWHAGGCVGLNGECADDDHDWRSTGVVAGDVECSRCGREDSMFVAPVWADDDRW